MLDAEENPPVQVWAPLLNPSPPPPFLFSRCLPIRMRVHTGASMSATHQRFCSEHRQVRLTLSARAHVQVPATISQYLREYQVG